MCIRDRIYPLDGATVEDMYHKSWINTVGGLFQFGRLYMYVPCLLYTSGSYTLQIRTVSNEEKYKTYETRSIQIIITPVSYTHLSLFLRTIFFCVMLVILRTF